MRPTLANPLLILVTLFLTQIFAIAQKQQAYPPYVLEVAPDPQADGPDVRASFTLVEEPSAPSDKAPTKIDGVASPAEKSADKEAAKAAPQCCVIL